jgi:hypothetical protein
MLQTVQRKVSTVLRYLFPTAADRAYLAKIRGSGLFDREFYLTSNVRLKWLFRIWPERDYVQLGERNGTCPNPGFSPRAYLFHNLDLAGETRPFLHYIETGRAEQRMVLAGPTPGSGWRMGICTRATAGGGQPAPRRSAAGTPWRGTATRPAALSRRVDLLGAC